MKHWEVIEVANSAYRHGKAYADGMIYRSANRTTFKHPDWTGLPNYVVHMPYDDHVLLSKVYRHAFRQGLKSI